MSQPCEIFNIPLFVSLPFFKRITIQLFVSHQGTDFILHLSYHLDGLLIYAEQSVWKRLIGRAIPIIDIEQQCVQILLFESLPGSAWELSDLYDAALAYISEGFDTSSPRLIQAAHTLLQQLEERAVRSTNLTYWILSFVGCSK